MPRVPTAPGRDAEERGTSRLCAWQATGRAVARDWSESVLDLMFVGIVVVFFGLTFGYAAFCDRL